MTTPHIILLGYGALDTLQLTVETQRVLTRYGVAYCLGVPANLGKFLKSQRVKLTDLSDRLAPGRGFGEAYLDIAHYLIERTAHERPVVFLTQGNPLMFNAIGRYLAAEAPRLEIEVQAVPGVSPVDVIIASIGLDVSTFGLQVFDATRLVSRRMAVNASVPLILLNAGTFALEMIPGESTATDLRPLIEHLGICYPAQQVVTVVRVRPDAASVGVAQVPLARLNDVAKELGSGAHLFIDAVQTNKALPAGKGPALQSKP